jgi:hypothetical protein
MKQLIELLVIRLSKQKTLAIGYSRSIKRDKTCAKWLVTCFAAKRRCTSHKRLPA